MGGRGVVKLRQEVGERVKHLGLGPTEKGQSVTEPAKIDAGDEKAGRSLIG